MLATCNRVEVLAAARNPSEAVKGIRDWFTQGRSQPPRRGGRGLIQLPGRKPWSGIFSGWRPAWIHWCWANPRSWARSRTPTAWPRTRVTLARSLNRLMHKDLSGGQAGAHRKPAWAGARSACPARRWSWPGKIFDPLQRALGPDDRRGRDGRTGRGTPDRARVEKR